MTPELEQWLEENGPVACEVIWDDPNKEWLQTHYTCMHCNKGYLRSDPEFDFYKGFSPTHFLVRLGLVREGDPMCLHWVNPKHRPYCEPSTYFDAGHETFGWFSRCVDRERCALRRANNHAGVHHEQEALAV